MGSVTPHVTRSVRRTGQHLLDRRPAPQPRHSHRHAPGVNTGNRRPVGARRGTGAKEQRGCMDKPPNAFTCVESCSIISSRSCGPAASLSFFVCPQKWRPWHGPGPGPGPGPAPARLPRPAWLGLLLLTPHATSLIPLFYGGILWCGSCWLQFPRTLD